MKKRLADDPKSWGKQEGSGQATAAPTPEPSALPKPLTLADIRVGGRYVTLLRHRDGILSMRSWKPLGLPRPYTESFSPELHGLMVINVEILLPDGTTFGSENFAVSDGLERSIKWKDNGHRTFLETPEIVALIADIVERQDHAAYSALTGVKARLQSECPLPDQGTLIFSRTFGKGALQSLSDEFLRGFEDLLKAKG